MLREVAFSDRSQWWVYKALRQLKQERYIQALPRGKYLDFEPWALTDMGFEVVLMDRDDMVQYRFRPHAPARDYLATCLQIGPQGFGYNLERQYFTEQMLSSLNAANFPRSFRRVESHIPDGMTVYRAGVKEGIVGYEVDLNLKDAERYQNTFEYYMDGVGAHLVIWLVRNGWIAEKIVSAIREKGRTHEHDEFLSRVAFVGLDDFKTRVWDAQCFMGKLKGLSIRKLHANLWQSMGKIPEKYRQNSGPEMFFLKHKSPQKFKCCTTPSTHEIFKHPSGPGGEVKSL